MEIPEVPAKTFYMQAFLTLSLLAPSPLLFLGTTTCRLLEGGIIALFKKSYVRYLVLYFLRLEASNNIFRAINT